MPIEDDIDRQAFFDADEFGVSGLITLLPVGSNQPVAMSGIFDDAFAALGEFADNDGMSGSSPQLHCADAVLPSGDLVGARLALNIGGVQELFTIVEPKPDGTGTTILRLNKGFSA